ncbi:MAG: response regulator transcription factor [Nitrospirae bacterium]|nr:response regulator transcription factor [Nitrospirota bacterium]
MITIIISDDHKIFREGLKSLIQEYSDEFKILGEASSGSSTIKLIDETKADIAILDFSMPDMDGLDVLKKIKQNHNNIKTIMLTAHYDPIIFNCAVDLGVDGFLLKEDSFQDILTAIKTVIVNKKFISKTIDINSTYYALFEKLTDREMEIFKLLAKGLSINDISKRFQISVKTVDTHKVRIMGKLDIHTSVDIVRLGYRLGLHNER